MNLRTRTIQKLVLTVTSLIVIIVSIYYFEVNKNNSINDAYARINIARKLTDSLNPGINQLGNVWPPLPQVLMGIFASNTFLWQSMLAGNIISGVSFLILVFFLFKLILYLTQSKLAPVLGIAVLLTNPNLLFLQTQAMSEVLFLALIVGSTYFLVKWQQEKQDVDLIRAAILVACCTLTRYEGYLFLLTTCFLISLQCYLLPKYRNKAEGKIILFSTVAFFGVLSWSMYMWAIFGDPIYWLKIYGHSASIVTDATTSKRILEGAQTSIPEKYNFVLTLSTYYKASSFVNSHLLVLISSVGTIVWFLRNLYKKQIMRSLFILLPLVPALFVCISLFRGSIPIQTPDFNTSNFFSENLHLHGEYNIRYGLLVLPMVAIIFGIIASYNKLTALIVSSILFLNCITAFKGIGYYNLQARQVQLRKEASTHENDAATWFQKNYDSGLILISEIAHSSNMHSFKLPYKKYIHEGAGRYWTDSRNNIGTHATWIYMYRSDYELGTTDEDSVTKLVTQNDTNMYKFQKVYENKKIVIFKKI